MSTIFSQAVNALKGNNHSSSTGFSEGLLSGHKPQGSIHSRIKKVTKGGKRIITTDSFRKESLLQATKKIVKKPVSNLRLKLKRANSPDSPVWPHDMYQEGPPLTSVGVFLRNIPDSITSQQIKNLLNQKDTEYVLGMKIEKHTAEINFSRQDAAERAIENLNERNLMGKKIKAGLVSELNRCSLKFAPKEENKEEMQIEDKKDLSSFRSKGAAYENKMTIDEDRRGGKNSIFSRLKKHK